MIALRLLVPAGVMLAILSLSAGRADVWQFWAWTAGFWITGSATYALLGRVSPELVAERMKPPSDRDRATRRLVLLPLLAHLLLAGFDARFGWSAVPLAVQLTGLVLFILGFALVGWVLVTNPFASSAVRIQHERKQRVISHGPYALVRHPMYLAVVLVCVGSGPALGSWFAGAALLPVLGLFVRRTLIEDRMLRDELEGYGDYSQRVRWRVVPLLF